MILQLTRRRLPWSSAVARLGRAFAQAPAPDAAEQKKILADATDYAFNHERACPTSSVSKPPAAFRTFQRDARTRNWRPIDIIVERLAYFEHHEDYKVIEINGVASSIDHTTSWVAPLRPASSGL